MPRRSDLLRTRWLLGDLPLTDEVATEEAIAGATLSVGIHPPWAYDGAVWWVKRWFFLGAVLCVGASGCSAASPEGCRTSDDCPSDSMCVNGFCVTRTSDASAVDGDAEDSDVDGSSPDGGTSDGGPADAGPAICGEACNTDNPCERGIYECDGDEIHCVADGPADMGTVCRPADGLCDVEEVCDGATTMCPDDAVVDGGETCREATDGCDVAEMCDGTAKACPTNRFADTGTSCPDGFCDGAGACLDTCTPGAPCGLPDDPCHVGTIDCSGGTPSCTVAGNAPDGTECDAPNTPPFGACNYADTCDESATRSRVRTVHECVSGACEAQSITDTEICNRDRDGLTCEDTVTGGWSACGGFGGMCDTTGTRSRTITTFQCAGGSCASNAMTDTDPCTRDTDGVMCGSPMTGPWGACTYDNTCTETGSRSRTITTPTCSASMCGSVTTTETEPCTRSTTGNSCGSVSQGPWSTCGGFTGICGESGTRTRTITTPTCQAGACANVTSTESGACTRDTDGTVCDLNECGPVRCASGFCFDESDACPPGEACCGGVCMDIFIC